MKFLHPLILFRLSSSRVSSCPYCSGDLSVDATAENFHPLYKDLQFLHHNRRTTCLYDERLRNHIRLVNDFFLVFESYCKAVYL